MASPNVQYQQQGYFPPQMPDNRRRSSSYTDRYRPASYSNPPPYQPDPSLLGPHQYPLPPSPMPPQQPPYPVDNNMPNPAMQMQTVAQHQLGDEMGYRRPSASYPDGLTRPSYDGSHNRRPSHDSRYSHRSERSHHSHHSHHSRRHRRDDDDDDEDDYEDDRRHRQSSRSRSRSYSHSHSHNRNHHTKDEPDEVDAYRQRVKDRGDNVSRSWGGSLLSVFAPLKYLIEPRDKY